MDNFEKLVLKYFEFLEKYASDIIIYNKTSTICYMNDGYGIKIVLDLKRYELDCYFVRGEEYFTLQEGLDTIELNNKKKGQFQLGSLNDLNEGIIYMASLVKEFVTKINCFNEANFIKLYNSVCDERNKKLEQYYTEIDLKKAENYWREKNYVEMKKLLERHQEKLTSSQLKKLDYITKHI